MIWGGEYIAKAVCGGGFSWARFAEIVIGGDAAWFTIALSLAELIVVLLLLSRARRKYFYVLVGVILWAFSEYIRSTKMIICGIEYFPWYYKSAMVAVLFLVIGGLYSSVEKRTACFSTMSVIPIIMFAIYAVMALFKLAPTRTALDYQGLNAYGLLLSLMGIASMISLTKHLCPVRFVDWVGRHTIGLYFFSAIILKGICPMAKTCFPALNNYGMTLLCALASFSIGILIVYFINRWFPFIFDLRLLRGKYKFCK